MLPLWGDNIGINASNVSLVFGIASAVEMTLFYPVGVVMDRYGRKWAAVPCMLLMSLGLVVLPLSKDFGSLLAVGIIIAFGSGLGSGLNMTLGSDVSPVNRRAEFLGVWRAISDVGSAAGPSLVAVIVSAATLALASTFTGLIGVAGSIVFGWLVPETLTKRGVPLSDP